MWICGECHIGSEDRAHLSGTVVATCHNCKKLRANIGHCPHVSHVRGPLGTAPSRLSPFAGLGKDPSEPKRAPLEMGELYGLRTYTLPPRLTYLRGHMDAKWYSPRQRARCNGFGVHLGLSRRGGRAIAGKGSTALCVEHLDNDTCHCGIYVRPLDYDDYLQGTRDVIAVTQLWGTILEAWSGYRASEAHVVALCFRNSETARAFRRRARGYADVPITVIKETNFSALRRARHEWASAFRSDLITIPEAEAS